MSERQSFYVGIKGIICNNSGAVLILQDTSTGKWELPGGRIDNGQTIDEAFAREIGEELPGASLVGLGDVIHVAQGDFTVEDKHKLLLVFYMTEVKLPNAISLSKEHSAFAWVSSRTVKDYEIYTSDKAAINTVLN